MLAQFRGVLFGQPRRDFAGQFGIPPQLQNLPFASPSDVGSVCPDQTDPRFIDELTGAERAGAFVFCIWTAARLCFNDACHYRGDSIVAAQLASKIIEQPIVSRSAKETDAERR
ncbi:MAG: hypothetical protein ACJ8FM_02145 [Xanthobacteraceae bacterium]